MEIDEGKVAEALKKHAEKIERYQNDISWYGSTTDAERVEMGKDLLEIFEDCGVDVDGWTPGSFAQQMNNFYDWGADAGVWQTACLIFNVDPEPFE